MQLSDAPYALATFRSGAKPAVGLVAGNRLWDFHHALEIWSGHAADVAVVPPEVADMADLLGQWDRYEPILGAIAQLVYAHAPAAGIALEKCHLLAPVPAPGKVINAGLNFHDHAREMGMTLPPEFEPNFFWKGDHNCIIGASQKIRLSSAFVDWEAEPALVMGRTARNVSAATALDYVAGITCHNDVTDRRLMLRPDGSFDPFASKSRDTYGPLGPVLVPLAAAPDLNRLTVRCLLNDEPMQDFCTDQMVWDPARCVAHLSTVTTLEPGDVIALGTGAGVGWVKGFDGEERVFPKLVDYMRNGGGTYLKAGDRIAVEIPGVGRLENGVGRLENEGGE